MRNLLFFAHLTLLLCLPNTVVADKALAVAKMFDNPEVRKVVAFHIVRALPRYPLLFKLGHQTYSPNSHHHGSYMDELANVIARDVPVLDLLQEGSMTTHSIENLAKNVHDKIVATANAYVATQEIEWKWGSGLTGSEEDRLLDISNALESSAKISQDDTREGKGFISSQLLEYLADRTTNSNEQEKISNIIAMYKEFPQLEVDLTEAEAMEILLYADVENPTLESFNTELYTVLQKLDRVKVSLSDTLILLHTIDRLSVRSFIERETNKLTNKIRFWRKTDFAKSLAGRKRFYHSYGITWQDLTNDKYLISTTGKFLAKMGWGWQDLGELVYPTNEEAAELLYYFLILDNLEETAKALTAKKEKIDQDSAAIIDEFLAELPYLERKNTAINHILEITEGRRKGVTPDKKTPKALMKYAINEFNRAAKSWRYVSVEDFTTNVSHDSSFQTIRKFLQAGMSEKELQERLFTKDSYYKWVNGLVLTEQDLHAMRIQLDKPNQREMLLTVLGSDDIDTDIIMLPVELNELPLTLQKEGAALEFIKDEDGSRDEILTNITRAAQGEGEYRLLSETILRKLTSVSEQEINQVLDNIRLIAIQTSEERDGFISAFRPLVQIEE